MIVCVISRINANHKEIHCHPITQGSYACMYIINVIELKKIAKIVSYYLRNFKYDLQLLDIFNTNQFICLT